MGRVDEHVTCDDDEGCGLGVHDVLCLQRDEDAETSLEGDERGQEARDVDKGGQRVNHVVDVDLHDHQFVRSARDLRI